MTSWPKAAPVDSVAFSPDGRTSRPATSAAMSACGTPRTGRRTATLAEGSSVYSVAFSPDGRTLAVGDAGGHVGLWDTGSGRRTATLAEGGPVNGVAFSPDGQTLAVGDLGGHVGLWDTGKRPADRHPGRGQPRRQRGVQPGRPDARGRRRRRPCRPVGRRQAAGGPPPWPRAARSAVWRSARTARPSPPATAAAMSACGTPATGRRTATLAEGSPSTAWRSARTAGRSRPATTAAMSACGTPATGRRTATLAEGNPVYSVAFSPDGQTLAAGDYGGHIGLWDTGGRAADRHPGRRQPRLRRGVQPRTAGRSRPATRRPCRPVGRRQPAGGPPPWPRGSPVTAWRSARTARRSRPATPAAMSACGTRQAGRRTATLAEGSPVYGVAFSPDGRTLAAGDHGGNVGLWDAGNRPADRHPGRRQPRLQRGVQPGRPDARGRRRRRPCRPVGHRQAAGGPPPWPRAAPSTAWRSARTAGRSRSATTAAMSACGTPAAAGGPPPWPRAAPSTAWRSARTAGRSRSATTAAHVGLWDTGSGRRTATLAEGSAVHSVAFSPDGQTLAIGDLNGNVALLRQSLSNLTGGFLSRLICGEVRRNMTQAQWTANAPGQPYQKTCSAYP